MSLNDVITPSLKEYNCSLQSVKISLIEFIIDKLKFVLSNQNNRIDVVNSVLNTKIVDNLPIKVILSRIDIINKYAKNKNFEIFLANFKRINNILKSEKFSNDIEFQINIKLFETIEEVNLHKLINSFSKEVEERSTCEKSQKVLINSLINMNKPISSFFDNVIVNHDDINTKFNRFNLLKNLHNLILNFARFDLIED